mmetsp:Transcript_25778/g.47054  ORF Transcript_25778/g.47054 Transcript_25778/m.47054 type:complete len:243 (+) Transcript_25778:2362-3090(+)
MQRPFFRLITFFLPPYFRLLHLTHNPPLTPRSPPPLILTLQSVGSHSRSHIVSILPLQIVPLLHLPHPLLHNLVLRPWLVRPRRRRLSIIYPPLPLLTAWSPIPIDFAMTGINLGGLSHPPPLALHSASPRLCLLGYQSLNRLLLSSTRPSAHSSHLFEETDGLFVALLNFDDLPLARYLATRILDLEVISVFFYVCFYFFHFFLLFLIFLFFISPFVACLLLRRSGFEDRALLFILVPILS